MTEEEKRWQRIGANGGTVNTTGMTWQEKQRAEAAVETGRKSTNRT